MSEIVKCVSSRPRGAPFEESDSDCREDDMNCPKKDFIGKQELGICLGNDHIVFEVR